MNSSVGTPSGRRSSRAKSGARLRLKAATADRTDEFWPDSITVLDGRVIDAKRVHGARQLTDVYLLALAVQNGGRLVSFDGYIAMGAVKGAISRHLLRL